MTPLLWTDIETTSLVAQEGRILELGLVLTDAQLEVVATGSWVAGWRGIRDIPMDQVSREMHEANGLLDAVERSRLSLRGVEDAALAWVRHHNARGLLMAGRGIGSFDRPWLRYHMPALEAVWSHRNLDITTLRYFFGDEKREAEHRALGDLRISIGHLREYVARAEAAGLTPLPALVA